MEFKFDSEALIRELESIQGVEDTPIDYDEYEEYHAQITERELRGGL